VARAEGFLAGAIHHQHGKGKPAVVFDIDDTLLNTYDYEIANQFGFTPASNAVFVNAAAFPAVFYMPGLVSFAASHGYAVFFITGRPQTQTDATVTNLTNAGYPTPQSGHLFLKPSTSVTGPGDAIKYPVKLAERVDFEGELAVIIGRLCRGVPRERAEEVVFGYTCANDVTARDLQARDGQWTRAKGFDTFCPLGPWMETGTNPSDLEITTTVNGAIRQQARTSELLWDVPGLIAYVSQVMTLLPGDVLLTGTPAGVGPLTDGDEVSVTIESIGTLTNRVVIGD